MKKLFAACDFSFKTLDFPAEWKENGLRALNCNGIFCRTHLHAGTEPVELMKKMLLGLSGVLVFALLLPGCPTSGREYLFTEPMVVRIDLKKDGVCSYPMYIRIFENYENLNNDQYYQEVYLINDLEWSSVGYTNFAADEVVLERDTCGITISHASSAKKIQYIEGNFQITNYNPRVIDLSIHVQNLCSKEEFHYNGSVGPFDISVFPDCQKMLDGWKDGEKSYVTECYSHIPVLIIADYVSQTDFDWSNYHNYQCEDFQ